MNILGWLGSICFCLCALPQVILCIKQKNAMGVSGLFLLLWFLGECFYGVATILEFGVVGWLLCNYLLNILWISIIFYYWRKG